MNNSLYKLFTLVVLGMGLTRDDYLYGELGMVNDPIQPVRVCEK